MSKSEDLLATVLADLKSGRYRVGSKLPPLRELARQNKVSVSVAVKVYDELRRRNIIKTGGSRGTTVTAFATDPNEHPSNAWFGSVIDLNQTYPYVPELIGELSELFSDTAQRQGYIGPGVADPRILQSAGDRWFQMTQVPIVGRSVQVTASGQSALFSILLMLRRRLRYVYVDTFTYFGLRFILEALDLKALAVEGDEDGMRPDALEKALRSNKPGAIYLMPSVHSPMAYSMPAARIEDLARVAKSHDCPIIEDDPFRYLLDVPPPSFGEFYPEGTFSVSSFSKVYGAQTPLAFAAVPESARGDIVLNARSAFCEFALPQSWIISQWIMSGRIEEHLAVTKSVCSAFQAIAARIFPAQAVSAQKQAPFIWLKLPPQWVSSSFVGSAMRNGVHVAGGDDFWAGGERRGDYVRISAFPTSGPKHLPQALEILGTIYSRDRLNLA
ncbi:PLP-dependent aminotransferase family protein [Sinorhizobium sp. 8-89]|uniref:PLP-dependent aminotransferase family protein n=1 Tax=Sinorhizobium sp. 7-81 TaxID=3049087 RepID=UPI0024C2104A|nr:PLP-dependent aminotransferase family protein [Sinorhizobium sp. 7-81]MDK1389790.1 PLP-dependent aminotransferase family protein [Sinorhizobium sp. 7-81]